MSRATKSPVRGPPESMVVVAVTVLAVALLYARAPFAARQFWAEDGRDFFGDAMRFGAVRSLGHSTGGYYPTFSRVGGVLASFVPIRAAALVAWVWVAVVVGWLVATVTVSSRTWLSTWPARIAVGLSLVLLPVLGAESIANAANLQFVMLFACVVVLIGEPRSQIETINGSLVLAVTGLTTPVALFLVPFVAWRMLRGRSLRPDLLVTGWLVGTATQLLVVVLTRPSGAQRNGQSVGVVLERLERAGFRENLLPDDFRRVDGSVLTVVYFVAVAGVVWLAWRQGQRARAALLVAVPGFGVVSLLILGSINGAANRYLVLTGLCLVWTTMAAAETVAAALAGPAWPMVLTGCVAAVLLVADVAQWTPSDVRRSGSTWGESLDGAQAFCRDHPGGEVRLRIAPVREEKPDQWSIVLSCADVT